MIYSLAFRQADYYMEIIYHAIEINKMDVGKKIRIRILLMYAAVAVYNGQSKHAYVLCKKVQDSDYLYQDIDSQYKLLLCSCTCAAVFRSAETGIIRSGECQGNGQKYGRERKTDSG